MISPPRPRCDASPVIRVSGGCTMTALHRVTLGVSLALLLLASSVVPRASAQPPRRQPTPNDTLKSTEVATDHKVTFRIYAPKADEVSVNGDFGQGGKMTKDDKG